MGNQLCIIVKVVIFCPLITDWGVTYRVHNISKFNERDYYVSNFSEDDKSTKHFISYIINNMLCKLWNAKVDDFFIIYFYRMILHWPINTY